MLAHLVLLSVQLTGYRWNYSVSCPTHNITFYEHFQYEVRDVKNLNSRSSMDQLGSAMWQGKFMVRKASWETYLGPVRVEM